MVNKMFIFYFSPISFLLTLCNQISSCFPDAVLKCQDIVVIYSLFFFKGGVQFRFQCKPIKDGQQMNKF